MNETYSPHSDRKKCIALFKKLSDFIDREMDEEAYNAISEHTEKCPTCKACIESLKQTSKLCSEVADMDVPPAFSKKIEELVTTFAAKG